MSHETTPSCRCGGPGLPFIVLALGCTIATYTLMRDTRLVRDALDRQLQQAGSQMQQAEQQMQQANTQGQQVGAARQHYYGLYADLVTLARSDAEAAAIVQKYGIRINEPQAEAPAAAPAAPAQR